MAVLWFRYAMDHCWRNREFQLEQLVGTIYEGKPRRRLHSVPIEQHPTGVPAVGIVSTLFWATLTDFFGGKRYLVAYWIAITGIVTSAIILTPSTSIAGHFGAYYWAGSVYACQATFFAWANDALRHEEDSLRAIVIACMNLGSNAINAWWSIVLYSADFAPEFTRGMWAMIGVSIAMAVWAFGLQIVERKYRKDRPTAATEQPLSENVEKGMVTDAQKI